MLAGGLSGHTALLWLNRYCKKPWCAEQLSFAYLPKLWGALLSGAPAKANKCATGSVIRCRGASTLAVAACQLTAITSNVMPK
jgi:hypothetical protein